MKNKNGIVMAVIGLLCLCVAVSYSTAYYRVNMTYEENKPEENIVTFASSNSVDVTFDGGSEDISLENVLPGDSVSKTYTLTNNSNTTILYTTNLSNIKNTFTNKDIVYSLYEVEDDVETLLINETTLPSTQSESINLIECSSIEKNTVKKFKLVLHYLETDTDQSEDMGKEASASITLGEYSGVKCEKNITRLLSTTINVNGELNTSLDDVIVDETEDKNVRYVGENPNNYIWFNCYDYNDTSTCERWRIIGLMNNVSTVFNGTQSLLKIIRADEITDISGNSIVYWDYPANGDNTNIWDNGDGRATLRSVLNDAYLGTSTITTYGNKTYTFTKDSNNTTLPRGITNETLDILEQVNWNVTLVGNSETADTYYTTSGTIWEGYVGLMDPSDYGYATSGGDTGRDTCLGYTLNNWNSYSDCYSNSWIRYYNPTDSAPQGSLSTEQWTIRPYSGYSKRAMCLINSGNVDILNIGYSSSARPVIYISSIIPILSDDNSQGTYAKPYRVSIQ